VALALAGCGPSAGPTGEGGEAPAGQAAAVPEANAAAAAQLETRASSALRAALGVAPTRFVNLRSGANNAICGVAETLPSATSPGGPRPFLVTASGDAFVSRSETLGLEDPTDPFPNLYVQYCATPEEVQAIQARLARMGASDVQLPPGPADNLPLPPDLPPGPAAEPPSGPAPPAPPAQPRRHSQPRDDGSFLNAVVRPED